MAEVYAVKLYCADMGMFVAFEAIHERLARDAKLIELGGGITEIQTLTIARELLP